VIWSSKRWRIALERVWFKEVQDFPGGNGVAPSVIVEPQKHAGRQFFKAFFVPSFQIVEVEWYQDENGVRLGTCLDANDPNRGFDAQSGEYVDMVKAGIIDPTKVVRLALQNAASVAGLLVTTEAMVAEKPEKKPMPAMPHDHGMGGMDDF